MPPGYSGGGGGLRKSDGYGESESPCAKTGQVDVRAFSFLSKR